MGLHGLAQELVHRRIIAHQELGDLLPLLLGQDRREFGTQLGCLDRGFRDCLAEVVRRGPNLCFSSFAPQHGIAERHALVVHRLDRPGDLSLVAHEHGPDLIPLRSAQIQLGPQHQQPAQAAGDQPAQRRIRRRPLLRTGQFRSAWRRPAHGTDHPHHRARPQYAS
jgi:hypothetical protein